MYFDLPNKPLVDTLEISAKFIKLGCGSYHDACKFVWELPYGRNSDNSNWKLVLSESTGTCSTKHALLKALASELSLEVDLTLGIYPMRESNTPGVGKVLSSENIEYIPEAHCYLTYNKKRIDLTRFGFKAKEQISEFFVEKNIEPSDISEFKNKFHKEYISEHFGKNKAAEIWLVRERCIKALSS